MDIKRVLSNVFAVSVEFDVNTDAYFDVKFKSKEYRILMQVYDDLYQIRDAADDIDNYVDLLADVFTECSSDENIDEDIVNSRLQERLKQLLFLIIPARGWSAGVTYTM